MRGAREFFLDHPQRFQSLNGAADFLANFAVRGLFGSLAAPDPAAGQEPARRTVAVADEQDLAAEVARDHAHPRARPATGLAPVMA